MIISKLNRLDRMETVIKVIKADVKAVKLTLLEASLVAKMVATKERELNDL